MSKQANTKLIGAFVVGAVALIVVGILLFGSAKLFRTEKRFVMFFSDSISGLSIGAPVDFRGVRIGKVVDIKVILQKDDLSLHIPVIVEFEADKVRLDTSQAELKKILEQKGMTTFVELLIKQGARAQLVMQSFVTGQLGIHIDFFPDKAANFVNAEPGYIEFPTVESSLSELAKAVQNIPMSEIAAKLLQTLDGIEKLVNSPEMKDTMVEVNQTVKSARALLANLDRHVGPLAKNADSTLEEARKFCTYARQLAQNLDTNVQPIAAGLQETLKAAGATMKGANKAMDGIAGDNSPVRIELLRTLDELSSAARSLRVMAEYIENHPESLVRGKGK